MKIAPIKTSIVQAHDNLETWLDASIKSLPQDCVLAVTSKVVALCEGRVVHRITGTHQEKHHLVKQESENYLESRSSKYDLMLTIKHGVLAVNAGIDESNVDQKYYVLLPLNPFESAKNIWQLCRKKYDVERLGVIITDSKTTPLKWGVIGTCLGYCGFLGLRNEIGRPDLTGRPLKMTKINVAEALAVSAVFTMGEASEAQPLALITDIPNISFVDHSPSSNEISEQLIAPEDDAYWPVLSKALWKKGGAESL